MQATVNDKEALAGKFLTFALKGETYGLEILKVQEILGLMGVTHVPRTPDFIQILSTGEHQALDEQIGQDE